MVFFFILYCTLRKGKIMHLCNISTARSRGRTITTPTSNLPMVEVARRKCSTRKNGQTKQTFNITKSVNHSLVNLKPVKPASFTQFVFTVNFVFSRWYLPLVTWAAKIFCLCVASDISDRAQPKFNLYIGIEPIAKAIETSDKTLDILR